MAVPAGRSTSASSRSVSTAGAVLAMSITHRLWEAKRYLRQGGLGPFCGIATETMLGRNVYLKYLARNADDDGFIRQSVGEFELLVDPRDNGISHTLLHLGEWEPTILEIYRDALFEYRSETESHVLDVGANRGYFAFHAATVLPASTVHAIEPVPRNLQALHGGIEANEFTNVKPHAMAVGGRDTNRQLQLSMHSNLHTVADIPPEKQSLYTGETIEVEMVTIDHFLERLEIEPESVVSLRFDIEGAERELLEGASRLLSESGSLVVFAEIHPHRLSEGDATELLETFATAGFDIAGATSCITPKMTEFNDLHSHFERTGSNSAAEVVFTR